MKRDLISGRRFLLIPLALAFFALSPGAQGDKKVDGALRNGNTAEGSEALSDLTTGANNTAVGRDALGENTAGNDNTGTGSEALANNTTGNENTATGGQSLTSNTIGDFNTATGFTSLTSNATGTRNTGTGQQSLYSNTTGSRNTGTGFDALYSSTTGNYNVAQGWIAMFSNTTGFQNTADGGAALALNTTGSNNIALGFSAAYDLTAGDNNIDIGNAGVASESNTIRIGTQVATTDQLGVMHPAHSATFIAGISGTAVTGAPVIINSNGQLGVAPSSQRFKQQIASMDKASEAILALRPVTFRYKHELDPMATAQFGLVAEEVGKVNPDLVSRDAEGKAYTVRYEAVNAMLLNEFLKEHRKVQQLEATVAQMQKDFQSTCALQQKAIIGLTATLNEQASQIQKVSAQLEVSKPSPRTVANNQ
jgi:hypothetical protein